MKLKKLTTEEFRSLKEKFYCLTYAEDGFSPLTQFIKKFNVSAESITSFADQVNQRDDIGTLYPLAPVSCMPRKCVRDSLGYRDIPRHLLIFITENHNSIKSKNLVIDLGVPRLHRNVWVALEDSEFKGYFDAFDQVVVIENI